MPVGNKISHRREKRGCAVTTTCIVSNLTRSTALLRMDTSYELDSIAASLRDPFFFPAHCLSKLRRNQWIVDYLIISDIQAHWPIFQDLSHRSTKFSNRVTRARISNMTRSLVYITLLYYLCLSIRNGVEDRLDHLFPTYIEASLSWIPRLLGHPEHVTTVLVSLL
jgi:hypothetical protein